MDEPVQRGRVSVSLRWKMAEHHRKQLVPTGEVLHVAIAIILANVVVKLSPEVTKSSLFHFKKPPNRLNFNYFKERLVHFNGTVVMYH